jgi:hypothetical protein
VGINSEDVKIDNADPRWAVWHNVCSKSGTDIFRSYRYVRPAVTQRIIPMCGQNLVYSVHIID